MLSWQCKSVNAMNLHLSQSVCKTSCRILMACLLTVVLSGCGKEDNPGNKEPVYTFQKEKEYLFTMPVYNDVIRFYKYNTRVTQANPDAEVSETEIKVKEEEINQKVEIVDHGDRERSKGVMNNVGFKINDQSFDCNLCLMWYSGENYPMKPDKYMALGRDSLITLFKNADLSGFTNLSCGAIVERRKIDI